MPELQSYPLSAVAAVLAGEYLPGTRHNAHEALTEDGLARHMSGEESFDNGIHYRHTADSIRGPLFRQLVAQAKTGEGISADRRDALIALVEQIDPRTDRNRDSIATHGTETEYSAEELLFIASAAKRVLRVGALLKAVDSTEAEYKQQKQTIREELWALGRKHGSHDGIIYSKVEQSIKGDARDSELHRDIQRRLRECDKQEQEITQQRIIQFKADLDSFGTIEIPRLDPDAHKGPAALLAEESAARGVNLDDPGFVAFREKLMRGPIPIDPDDPGSLRLLGEAFARDEQEAIKRLQKDDQFFARTALTIAKIFHPELTSAEKIWQGGKGTVFISFGSGEHEREYAQALASTVNRVIKYAFDSYTVFKGSVPDMATVSQADGGWAVKINPVEFRVEQNDRQVLVKLANVKDALRVIHGIAKAAEEVEFHRRSRDLATADMGKLITKNFEDHGNRLVFKPRPHWSQFHKAALLAIASETQGKPIQLPENVLCAGSPVCEIQPGSRYGDIALTMAEGEIRAPKVLAQKKAELEKHIRDAVFIPDRKSDPTIIAGYFDAGCGAQDAIGVLDSIEHQVRFARPDTPVRTKIRAVRDIVQDVIRSRGEEVPAKPGKVASKGANYRIGGKPMPGSRTGTDHGRIADIPDPDLPG